MKKRKGTPEGCNSRSSHFSCAIGWPIHLLSLSPLLFLSLDHAFKSPSISSLLTYLTLPYLSWKPINLNNMYTHNLPFLKLFMLLSLSGFAMHISNPDPIVPASLQSLHLNGHFQFQNLTDFSQDFGNRFSYQPSSVLLPGSISDISATIKHVYELGAQSGLTVAARGHGHSLQGQAQAPGGIIIRMESLRGTETRLHAGATSSYIDVSGGELWINVLKETLKHGLAPKSWTDYLHLTVGGTLSNAGVSGQAFRHGPQISNVHELVIVTG